MTGLDGQHVSIDIEACGDVLLSIGACYFDPRTGESADEFYVALDVQSQIDAGLKMSGSAWQWWIKQSDAARDSLSTPGPVVDALFRFGAFLKTDGQRKDRPWCWAYPTSFDLPVIERVYKTFLQSDAPWVWTKTMDGRCLWRLACTIDPRAEKIEKDSATAHNALADAKQQAVWYSRYLNIVCPDAMLQMLAEKHAIMA